MKLGYQREAFNSHWFQVFNAISVQILMGAPAIVYVKSLGASSTVLGIIAAFAPLMTILQLPAAHHLERYGYKKFTIAGWSLRSIFIFVIAIVPILAFLDPASKMAVLLGALFVFHLLRGISNGAWLPWMTALIAEDVRGRFLSIDQCFGYAGSVLSFLISALALSGSAAPWEYSLMFLMSGFSAVISLNFLKRIPDIVPGAVTRRSSQVVPWRAIVKFPPFYELLIFNLLCASVLGSLGVFTVEYLHDISHFSVPQVLYLSALTFVGALVVLPFLGPVIDQTGSKFMLRIAVFIFGVILAFWCLCAAQVLPNSVWLIAALNLTTGVASALFGLAFAHLLFATMPEMGRNHFFALFTVISSLGLTVTPISWGLLLDALGSYEIETGIFHWKRHSIFFLGVFLVNAIAFAYIPRLHESSAGRAK